MTGASGFIGQVLVRELESCVDQIFTLNSSDGSITSSNAWKKYEGQTISHLFHLAGKTFVPASWDNSYEFYETNMFGTVSTLEFCRKNSIPITYVSAYIYGIPEQLPIKETATITPNNPYAHSKYMAEELCRFYAATFNMDITIVRPFNVYGEGQPRHFLIPSVINQSLHHNQIEVMDLFPKRDYVHVNDVASALIATMGRQAGFEVFNVGSGVSYSVKQVIELVKKYSNQNKAVVCNYKARPNEIDEVVADCSKAHRELNWQCQVSFESGIKRLIDWEYNR